MPTDVVETTDSESNSSFRESCCSYTWCFLDTNNPCGPSLILMSHVDQSGKFGRGADFKRWHQEMMFFLITLNLVGCLTDEAPVVAENKTDNQKVIVGITERVLIICARAMF